MLYISALQLVWLIGVGVMSAEASAQGHQGLLAEMVDAVNQRDAGRYARVYADDAVITIFGSVELRGRKAIEQHELELLKQFPVAHLAFLSIWESRGSVAAHYGVTGRTNTGQEMGHEGLLFFRFNASGLIAEEHRYLDSLTPMAQLGAPVGILPVRSKPALPAKANLHISSSAEEQKNIVLVRSLVSGALADRHPALLAAASSDATVDDFIFPLPLTTSAWLQTWITAVPDATTSIANIFSAGDFVLVEAIVRGTVRGALGTLRPSGQHLELHRAFVIEVKNGRIPRIWTALNGKELAGG